MLNRTDGQFLVDPPMCACFALDLALMASYIGQPLGVNHLIGSYVPWLARIG
jgi:hypothetical protein